MPLCCGMCIPDTLTNFSPAPPRPKAKKAARESLEGATSVDKFKVLEEIFNSTSRVLLADA